MNWTNWAGNQRGTAARLVRPTDAASLAEAIRAARADGLTVKAHGSGHSFTDTALTDGVHLDLTGLASPGHVDRERRRVTVPAGMPLHALNPLLAGLGLALPNLGDIDAQTIAGPPRRVPTAPAPSSAACPPSSPG